MKHTTRAQTFLVAEGIISFMNKKNNLWAIKYGGRYYPFEPHKCIGWKNTFDSLKEGDHIYFPLIRGHLDHLILLTHLSTNRTEILKIKSLEVTEENRDMTFWLLIPGLG